MLDLFAAVPASQRPTIIAPEVGDSFEFGTSAYRAAEYTAAVVANVPAGVPMIVSNDAATWEAGAHVCGRNPMIGVLHGNYVGYDRLVTRLDFRTLHRGVETVVDRSAIDDLADLITFVFIEKYIDV